MRSNFFIKAKPPRQADKSHFVFPGFSEVNTTWLITSELANQRAQYYSLVWYILIVNNQEE